MAQEQGSKTWLVTGASQGLGLAITLAALRAGHKVIAGARNPETAASAHPEVEEAGGQWLQLDVTSKETKDIVQNATEDAGGIDVVVNNAGYFLAGSIEDLEEDEMQAAMDTNFWGPIRVFKGALPSMRARKSGTIVSISSIFAFYPCPGGAMYSCPKAAQDALQSILGKELASFNIRTVIINAGLYKTNVLVNSKQPSNGFSESYLAPLGPVLNTVGTLVQDPSQMPGDPTKFGERIVDVVDGTGLAKGLENTSRFWFGRDAMKLSSIVMKELEESFKGSNDIATSTDFEGHTGDGVAVVSDFYK